VQLLGVDPLQAGNVVQLLVVLGMTVGWISTYMFRVANKDMTYAHQLRDYEKQVMEVRVAASEFIGWREREIDRHGPVAFCVLAETAGELVGG